MRAFSLGHDDARIHEDRRTVRDRVVGGARRGDRRCDGRAEFGLAETVDVLHLMGEFHECVDALFWFEARVRCTTLDEYLERSGAFARGLQGSAVGAGLEHENRVDPPGHLFDEAAARLRADFFVGGEQHRDVRRIDTRLLQNPCGVNRLHDARFHVEHARPAQHTGFVRERSLFERTHLVHRVVVSEEQHGRTCRCPNDDVRAGRRIDELGDQSGFASDEFGNASRTLGNSFHVARR